MRAMLRIMSWKGLAFGLVFLSLAALSVSAADTTKEKVTVTAQNKVSVDLNADVTVFEGGVKIAYGDVEIMAERAEVRERKIATLTGGAKLVQSDMVLRGEVFTAYISEKTVIAEGGIVLTKEEETDTITVECDKMELSTKTRGFKAEGNVRVRKGSSWAKANQATYVENDKVIVLQGDVVAEGKNGESIKCEKLIFRTDRDYMEAETEVVFEFEIDEDANDM